MQEIISVILLFEFNNESSIKQFTLLCNFNLLYYLKCLKLKYFIKSRKNMYYNCGRIYIHKYRTIKPVDHKGEMF